MKSYILLFALIFAVPCPADAALKDFLKRGLKHCKGRCDQSNIKCEKGKNKQGYYDWCNAKCTYEGKSNRQDFLDAIAYCDNEEKEKLRLEKGPSEPSIFDETKTDGENYEHAIWIMSQVMSKIGFTWDWDEVLEELKKKPASDRNYNEKTAKVAHKNFMTQGGVH